MSDYVPRVPAGVRARGKGRPGWLGATFPGAKPSPAAGPPKVDTDALAEVSRRQMERLRAPK